MTLLDDFKKIKGHHDIIDMLERAVQEGRVSHAYLFAGPGGIGKMKTAQALASRLLHSGDPEAGLFLQSGVHPDLLIIEKEENRSLIGIELITKTMEPWLALKPYRGTYRVILLHDAHLLSEAAGNALLKVLEEPPPYAVIILIADQLNLSETIQSRCQLLRFAPLAEHLVVECLKELGVEDQTARRAAALGQGSVGLALKFASEEGFALLWDKARQLVAELEQDAPVHALLAAEKMEENAQLLCAMMETVLRDILLYRLTEKQDSLQQPDNIKLAGALKNIDPQRIIEKLNAIAGLKRLYRLNVSPLLINIQVAYAVREALK
ncbi:MAG: hypothetical protein ABFD04_04250 [Syntrophomonas sp.]